MNMIEHFELKDGRVIEIKILTREDYEQNNNYEYVHNWHHQVNTYLNYEFNPENLERDRKDWFENYIESENEILIGALFNGRIIGTTALRLNLRVKKRAHVGEWGIAIHPDFHNQGLGKKLLTILEDMAKEKGLKKLEADYYVENLSAEHLYLNKMNYEVEGRRKFAALLKDGTYTDRVSIGKIIDDSLLNQKK